ncbi:MAG: molybdopterin-dependent oxidoreductase [Thermodesulfobacteriota bacterium]
MVNLTIDGRAIQAPKGQTILEVADANGIFIPRLCYHPALKPIGACRICVVEVKPGPPRPLPACATPVNEGMEVVTNSERLQQIRSELMKLVLINHALECPICDKGGECELQDLTHALAIDQVDLEAVKLAPNPDYESLFVERHPDRCVTCGRCVHVCRDHVGAMAINFMHRGYFTELGSGQLPLDCEFCGSCIDICPVGALINKLWKYKARAWEVEKTETVCPFCGGGCTYELHTKNDRILRVRNEKSILLCSRGRFGFPVVEAPDRLTTPLIKENGEFREASWDEALDLVAAKFKEIAENAGPNAIYGVGSARATNEANYLFQKFFRQGLGSNQVDNAGRYTYIRALRGLASVFGVPQVSGVEASSAPPLPYHSPLKLGADAQGSGFPFVLGHFADLPKADLVLVLGADVTPEMPPLGWKLLRALDNENFRLVLANPRRTKFDRYAHVSLRYKPGTERILLAGLLKAFLADNPEWTPAISANGLEEFKESLKKIGPKEVSQKTGVDDALIKETAALLAQAQAPAILCGTELLAQDKGEQNVQALADLFLLIGKPGTPGSAIFPVAEKNNSRGVCEAGVMAERLPGYAHLDEAAAGTPLPEMLDKLEAGDPAAPQALYLLGGDLLRALPHRSRTEKLLKKMDFIVVQDAFLSDTAKMAQVVLPVAVHAEQEGTFISSDGTLGVLAQAVPANGVRPDWQIINQLGDKMGYKLGGAHPQQIFRELAAAVPLWAGLSPQAGYPLMPGTVSGTFVPFDADLSLPGRRPYTLIVGKALNHSGTFTTYAPEGTLKLMAEATLQLNPEDAQTLGLAAGETAKVISSQGEISAPVALAPEMPPGVVFLAEHFAQPPVHLLTINSNLVRVTIQKG